MHPPPPSRVRWSAALTLLFLFVAPARARAAWPGDDGLDAEDLVAVGVHRTGSTGAAGRSWISLAAFERVFAYRNDVGVLAVVGLALDRIATGPVHALTERTPPWPPAEAPKERAPPPAPLPLDPTLARATVGAAWRAVGLGEGDAKIDAVIARARQSAALPETRVRAMRLVTEAGRVDTTTGNGNVRFYDAAGAHLWLEARLTWHLDRLLYADDEPTLERVRLERIEARARLAARVLDLLFQWQRARLDQQAAPPGTREDLDAQVRVLEAEVALDVLTAGGFARARRPREPPGPT